jgi:hypothetical protein
MPPENCREYVTFSVSTGPVQTNWDEACTICASVQAQRISHGAKSGRMLPQYTR